MDEYGAARIVDAATHALAVTAPDASGTTAGIVVNDNAAAEREARSTIGGGPGVENAAALAVAAVAPEAAGAARGLVIDDRRVSDGAVRRGTIDEAAPLARAAPAASGATAATARAA